MERILIAIGRWIARHIVNLGFVIAVLVAGKFIIAEASHFLALVDEMKMIDSASVDVEKFSKAMQGQSDALRGKSIKELDRQIAKIDLDIIIREEEQRKSEWVFKFPSVKSAKRTTEIQLLKQEREYLINLRGHVNGTMELETLRQRHQLIYNALMLNQWQQDMVVYQHPVAHLVPGMGPYMTLQRLKADYIVLYKQNGEAYTAYDMKRNWLRNIEASRKRLEAARLSSESAMILLKKTVEELEESRHNSWIGKIIGPVLETVPVALRILTGIILLPLAIKVLFYYVLAPIASRRPSISLLPQSSGLVEPLSLSKGQTCQGIASSSTKISQVSLPIHIDAGHEILVHPEYLQSSTISGKKDTKWLLNNSYPWSSVLSGMVMLTRIRTDSGDSITVSAVKEPLTEVGAISLPEGSSLVLKPRFLIGVISPTGHPMKITRHWRIASLHAWLTLQIRFLVFHGPGILVVKGGRGVRLEPAQAGRSINQELTMGFSANLLYATTRCETFISYLTGKKNLLNDRFAGDVGLCVYEEMPIGAKHSGVTGRRLEGLTEGLLNVFGV